MSSDYSIRCLDCEETMPFSISGYVRSATRSLVEHAGTIAKLEPLLEDGVELSFGSFGHVDVGWFVKHAGHRLRPIDEYGAIDFEGYPETAELVPMAPETVAALFPGEDEVIAPVLPEPDRSADYHTCPNDFEFHADCKACVARNPPRVP